MSIIVDIPNKKSIDTEKQNDQYTFCHGFTKDVILGIYENGELAAPLRPCMQHLIAANDAKDIVARYICMSGAVGGLRRFNKNSMQTVIREPGLILFSYGPLDLGGTVQHSMIAIKWDEWQGANNMGSLGPVDPNNPPVPTDMFVLTYQNMYDRGHVHGVSGGWDDDGEMCSVVDALEDNKRYTMYYLPLFAEQADDECCSCCIIS